MWHIEIQEGRLEAEWESAQEELEATRGRRQVQGAKQLLREEQAERKAERNQLLRAR